MFYYRRISYIPSSNRYIPSTLQEINRVSAPLCNEGVSDVEYLGFLNQYKISTEFVQMLFVDSYREEVVVTREGFLNARYEVRMEM